jgi:putative colanic acid polymerase
MATATALSVVNQLISKNVGNEIQFLRTLTLVLITIFGIGVAISGELKLKNLAKIEFVLVSLVILTIISIAQALLGYRFGSFVTNPLGNFTYHYQYKADLNSSLTRASGLYSEPSFNALVCLSFVPLVFSIVSNRKRFFYIVLLLLYMTSTFSLTGILSLSVVLLLWILDDRKINFIRIVFFVTFITFMANYIVQRIGTLSVTGSSANFRLIAPIKAIAEILPQNIFGIPLGSLENTIFRFGFLNGSKVGTSVDNGYLLLIIYFGLAGLILTGAILIFSVRLANTLRRLDMRGWQMAIVPALALNFNGGIFLPDFICIMIFIIVTIRYQFNLVKIEDKLYA